MMLGDQAVRLTASPSPLRGRILLTYVPALVALPVVMAPPLNHDVAALLEFSQRWLAGEPLYARLIDANPPLIFVLNLVPAVLAEATGANAILALQFCVLIFAAVVWGLSTRVRRDARAHTSEGTTERLFLDVVPVLLLTAAGYEFGQREHLMTLGALPYLFSAARRAQGENPPHRLAVTLVAAAAFALKPHFLAIPALVELYLLLARGVRSQLRDPVPWIMAAVWAAYLAVLPVLFPAYFTVVVPLVLSNYLSLGDLSFAQMILVPRMATALLLLVPLIIIAALWGNALARILCLAALGAAVSAIMQRKGWSYHILPAELFPLVLAGTLAARRLDLLGAWFERFRHAAVCGLAALVVLFEVASGEAPDRELGYAAGPAAAIAEALKQTAAGRRALVLSPRIWPVYPAMNYARVRSTLRSMTLWVLQGAYHQCLADGRLYRDPAEMDWAERLVFETVAQDLAADPPEAVVIDRIPGIPWCGEEFDLLAYFRRNPTFAAAWARYRPFGARDELDFYVRAE